jgi:hypothetical protein
MPQYIQEEEFDRKLKEIGDHYENGKQAVYNMFAMSNKYDIDQALESIRNLRDIAATALRSLYEIKDV